MQHPEYVYYGLIALIAWPCSLFSRCSAVLTLTWVFGQIAVMCGLSESAMQVGLYASAGIMTVRWARYSWCYLVGALYLPLWVLAVIWWTSGQPETVDTYWSIYGLAVLQIFCIPGTVNWSAVEQAWDGFKRRREFDDLMRVISQVWGAPVWA